MSTQKRQPAYAWISDEIAAEIACGTLRENEQLPTERDMCEKYGVSRITVRHALSLLEQQGLIRKRQGQGIFVCPRRYEQSLDALYSYDQLFARQSTRHELRVLSMEQRAVSGDIAARLGVFDRSVCTVFTTVCLAEDKPYAYNVSYVPQQLVAGASAAELEQLGLYALIEKYAGLKRDRATERFEASLVPGEVLSVLGRRAPLAAMKQERVSAAGVRPIELTMSWLVGDKIGFRLVLS